MPSYDSCTGSFQIPQCSRLTPGKTKRDVIQNTLHNYSTGIQERTKQLASLSLKDLMDCSDKTVANRQVRTLASCDALTQDILSTPRQYRRIVLENAKQKLQELAFFGLAEYQELTDKLFKWTFGQNRASLRQNKRSQVACLNLDSDTQARIKRINSLDFEFYEYAERVFFERVKAANL